MKSSKESFLMFNGLRIAVIRDSKEEIEAKERMI